MVQDNLVLGKKLASGGFGTVYRADLIDVDQANEPIKKDVIVKKVNCAHATNDPIAYWRSGCAQYQAHASSLSISPPSQRANDYTFCSGCMFIHSPIMLGGLPCEVRHM